MIGGKKTAIVISGGGMRCAYSAGSLVALYRHFGFTDPDFIIVGSGAVGSTFYFISKQPQYTEKIWTEALVDDDKFISFTRVQIMDVDYLVDDILKRRFPLDSDTFSKSNIEFFVPIRNADTGKLQYVSRDGNLDPYEIMRAAKAMPLAYNEKIRLKDSSYVDGYLGLNLNNLILKAIEEGAQSIIAIDTSKKKVNYIHRKLFDLFLDDELAEAINDSFESRVENLTVPENVTLIRIDARESLQMGFMENDKEALLDAFSMGYRDTVHDKDVRALLEKLLKDAPENYRPEKIL